VDAADLADIVDVLVDNVFAHTPEGTDFSVSLGSDGADMVLVVSDHGPGLTQTGSDRPGSTGLGLQIVRRTVAGLHGRMQARPGPGGGTTIEVRLPAGREPTSDGHRARRGSEHP
jgi:signal transduction histidine kinase